LYPSLAKNLPPLLADYYNSKMNQLQKYLRINSIFSFASGLSMLLFSKHLNAFMQISNKIVLPVIGINLIIFGASVMCIAQRLLPNKKLVSAITLLDIAWVIGSLLLVALQPFGVSSAGNILILVVAIWIAFLAYKQKQYNN
jgi:cellulose synthase/poly-beta-1,6-N-acetylglucosamine synthase-like glycosyltransferase